MDRSTISPLTAPLPQPRLAGESHRVAPPRSPVHDNLAITPVDPGPHSRSQLGARSRVLLAAAALTTDPAERTRLQEEVAVLHLGLARAVAARYHGSGTSDEDLDEAAATGLLAAVRDFDGDAEQPFLPYALATVKAHVKARLAQDAPPAPRPVPQAATPEEVHRLTADIARARAALRLDLGRSPRVGEVARHLGVGEESVVEAVADLRPRSNV